MFELLFFVLSIVFVIGFIMPFLVMWFAIDHIKIDKVGRLAIVIGFLIAFFVSSILYLSVATISHNLVEFYSHYGSKFSEFYTDLSFNTTVVANIMLIVLWFDKTFIGNNNFAWSLLMSYQVSLFALFIFNPLLVLILEKLGLIDVAIAYFAKSIGILSNNVDIRNDLIHPKLSTSSYIQMGAFFFFNQILVILMAIRWWRTAKHQPKSD